MRAGVYIHIPYCLQQCPYCDFSTVKHDHPIGPSEYINLLRQEILNRKDSIPFRDIHTLYFGGGTPSLLSEDALDAVIQEFKFQGFNLSTVREITLEINPGTVSLRKLQNLMSMGFNRFSVGVQTFDAKKLGLLGREHSVEATLETLGLLKLLEVNFSADLLFAHPYQSMADLQMDLDQLLQFSPPHVSAYCLTLPERHPLQVGRPDEDIQSDMIELVRTSLEANGLLQYEISNFSRPGFESKNNSIYWEGQPYWGLGMSAHSYFPSPQWGARFWNPPTIEAYRGQVHKGALALPAGLPRQQFEILEQYQALTDFCHVRMRTRRGLDESALSSQFTDTLAALAVERLNRLLARGLVQKKGNHWRVRAEQQVLSEQVFKEMTFLKEDLV